MLGQTGTTRVSEGVYVFFFAFPVVKLAHYVLYSLHSHRWYVVNVMMVNKKGKLFRLSRYLDSKGVVRADNFVGQVRANVFFFATKNIEKRVLLVV